MPSAKDAALALVLLYAAVLTYIHFGQRPNPICARDFVDPKLQGSCFSGADGYSMCTPSLAADVIIELLDDRGDVSSLVFIVRGDGRGLAIVGGFVRVGESAEAAAAREALEETGLVVDSVRQWCLFSAPNRDPRRHTAAQVHIATARGVPRAADDAKGVRAIRIDELKRSTPAFAFDHGAIVDAYLDSHHRRRKPAPGGIAGACARRLS
jgi:8-oxo-dGTP diphosphatase